MQDVQVGPDGRGRRWLLWAGVLALVSVTAMGAGASSARALPDGRAYELVSPVEKNGGGVTLGPGSIRASSNGDAVVFDSDVAFGDTKGSGGTGSVTYRSDRGATAWSTHGLLPPQNVNPNIFGGQALFLWFAGDLSHAILRAADPPLVPGAPLGVPNLYVTDGHGGSAQLITASANPVTPHAVYPQPFDAVSADFSHVAFESFANLTADTSDSNFKLYEWTGAGGVKLAGVMPDGTPAPSGASAGPLFGGLLGFDTARALSDDGSRLYFTTDDTGLLYLRKNVTTTEWVSQSEASSPEATPEPATFVGASTDGSRALFMTNEPLVDGDQNASTDLYMYTDSANPATDSNLTLISKDNDPTDGSDANVDGVLGTSDDGSRIYFAAEGQLVAGQPATSGAKLYVWDHGTVRYITTLGSADITDDGVNWVPQGATRTSRVTADGRFLVFETAAPQPGTSNVAGHREVYRYDADSQQIACVSCDAAGNAGSANASVVFPGDAVTAQYIGYVSRALSADGRRVFFNTSAALVPEDTNGTVDAYEWEDGAVHLLSSGQSNDVSYFVDASANGDDAYFVTREQLVGWDIDHAVDLYDAKVGGGLPQPSTPPAPCSQEACQGPLSAVAPAGPTGSSVVSASGTKPRAATFTVSRIGARQRREWASTGKVTVRVRVSGAGTLVARAVTDGSPAATSTRRKVRKGGAVALTLRLPPTARRHLQSGRRVRVNLVIRYSLVKRAVRISVTLAPTRAKGGKS